MSETNAIAVVGVGAILPDAPDAQTFWKNIQAGRYSITDVPADRWRADLFFDPNPAAPDKTYSKLGGWVRGFKLDAKQMGIAIPPRVLAQIDEGQQWAIAASFEALKDYGYPSRHLDLERIAVILGSALGGELHYHTTIRIHLPEYLDILSSLPSFQNLPKDVQDSMLQGFSNRLQSKTQAITEDTMPGELSNIIAGRVANVFNFSGPNFVTDAACASSLAALQSAMEGLISNKFDAVLTGGVDRNMGAEAFVKFSKIGALSPDGSRPYAEGANGFIMGEGAAIFLLKRLVDAERDSDKIYAVVRGIGGSSDGKGKGITAPNPLGQQRALERAWKNAGVSPESVGLIEGHGTSTPVGDVAEVSSLNAIFGNLGMKTGSVALGSVKSNFGHLKSAAGAAGLLKTIFALHNHLLPPSVNFQKPNSNIDFAHMPFVVNTGTRPWDVRQGDVRRAGVSAFGFGGTNFHVVLEEYLPGLLNKEHNFYPGAEMKPAQATPVAQPAKAESLQPYHGMLFVSADTVDGLRQALREKVEQVKQGKTLPNLCPVPEETARAERLVIDYEEQKDSLVRATKALSALEADSAEAWQALSVQGIYRGRGKPIGKVAFLFPGQGSQYVNMLRDLRDLEPIVADTFREADEVMTPILGRPITSYIFMDGDTDAIAQAETKLRHTDITQPAILSVNVALLRVMAKFGFQPDLVIGHSLGEYGALVAAGVMTFSEALRTVSARGQEMVKVAADDNGCMAAVSAPIEEVERILKAVDGYVVIANYNSPVQCVIGGSTVAVEAAIAAFQAAGLQAAKIPVSHAFHTKIVAAVGAPLRKVINQMNIQSPRIPIIANVTGGIYPTSREEILDILAAQVGSPVRFVQGINKLYEEGVRIFVEVGPKRVLSGLASDILRDKKDVTVLATNHPRKGDLASINEAMCRLFAAGVKNMTNAAAESAGADGVHPQEYQNDATLAKVSSKQVVDTFKPSQGLTPTDGRMPLTGSVVISGVGLGLPGRGHHVFDDNNILSLLNGEMRIEPLSVETREAMLEKHPVRLVKSESGAVMQVMDNLDQTIKLGGQRGEFDPVNEFGFPPDRIDTLDISTQLAISAGIEALRDAGIPLVMTYRQTSTGSYLPNGWKLPESLADETGVIFGSAFPGLDRMASESEQYYQNQAVLKQLEELRRMSDLVPSRQTDLKTAFNKRIAELEAEASRTEYRVDRRYIFRILSMGHSQFAEYIDARGPNTQVNAACATTTNAIAIAEDWIRAGRARRVIIIAGDDVISGSLPGWIATSLMASGAATVEGDLRLASLPFDRRRNGMIIGMGAAALVLESEDAVRERGMRAICEVLASHIANSAYHGTRLSVDHVSQVMESLLTTAERRFGISRSEFAKETVFVSHETYTPARGGSAAAEIHALRHTFGENANQVIIANTKGYTGHTMGVGIEDVIAVKALEYGIVPPIANIQDGFEPDPELGDLNLSRGGKYPVQYSLRLGAGFGSQIAMTLLRKVASLGERVDPPTYHRWLSDISGYPKTELEISQRTLRIKDQGVPPQTVNRSRWEYGQVPTLWATFPPLTPSPSRGTPVGLPEGEGQRREGNHEEIKTYLLTSVSKKTGYPAEMLDLDLDLEADLGIDTVKQAELFASIREHYGIPRREDLRLADYNTLAKVIGFVEDALGTAAAPAPTPAAQPVTPTSAQVGVPAAVPSSESKQVSIEEIKSYLLTSVSEKTGYPTEMLDLNLDLEADLGIDTVKQAELFASIREHYGIPRREDLRLADYNTLAKVIGFVEDALGATAAPVAVAPVVQPLPPLTPSPSRSTPVGLPGGEGQRSEGNREEIKTYLLTSVSEKTGYPTEMLDIDLDLEADLGIDTVKQAELFALIREHYGIPRREDLRLADYNTLAKVIGFVEDALRAQDETASAVIEASVSEEEIVAEAGEKQNVIVRRVPVPTLRPRLDLCVPTTVELTKGTRVIVVESKAKTAEPLVRKLQNLDVEVLRLNAGSGFDAIAAQMTEWLAQGPVRGVYFLPALEVESRLSEMNITDWQSGLEQRLYSLYSIMRALPEETFLICATRLGGLHGYSAEGATAPMGGAVSGFAKALARERTRTFVKVVDFEHRATPTFIANCLIEETLHDPGAVEVGRENELRFGIATIEEPYSAEENFALENGSVFLVSGGSSGIVQPIVEDLTRATCGIFYLLGRAPLPEPNNSDITRLNVDRAGLKQELITRLSGNGKKATPVQVEQALLNIERSAAILATVKTVEQLGGKAHYVQCDITDPAEVETAVQKVKEAEGRVDIFLHAAGLERSRKLESKPFEEFRQVVAVKADGFFNIFKSLESKELLPRAMVFFSSVAGRFGNSGQTDYSAANDLLCKTASAIRSQYPAIKTVAMDWSAWGSIGMATRGNIPALMKMAGIDLIPPERAAPMVRAELLSGNGESVVASSLGLLLEPCCPHGGMDLDAADRALRAGKPIHTMLSHITDFDPNRGLVLEAELDPKTQPFLYDHARNGTPILPGVMGIEGFAIAAKHIGSVLSSGKGGMEVSKLEDIRFLTAFKFYRNEPRHVTWIARTVREGNGLVVYVTLESTRVLKTGDAEHMQHFSGKVYLQPQGSLPAEASARVPKWNGRYTVRAEDIYKIYFHGPAFQVLEGVQRSGNVVIGKLNKNLPAITGEKHSLASAPTLLELCFQTAGIWEIGATGTMALPRSIESLTIYRQSINGIAIYAEVNPFQGDDGSLRFDARVVDARGRLYLDLKEYRTTPVQNSVEAELLVPLKELVKNS